jgi:uncharacterized protein with GYD domain
MGKYLIKGNYVGEGVTGLLGEGGSSRRRAVEALVASLGGSVESMYYAFGETDVFVIVNLPDNASAVAASLVAGASGAVETTVTVLVTPEEVDAAVTMAPDYRPPGDD